MDASAVAAGGEGGLSGLDDGRWTIDDGKRTEDGDGDWMMDH